MHSFGKMLKALPHHARSRSRSRSRDADRDNTISEPILAPAKAAFGQHLVAESGKNVEGRKRWSLVPETPESVIAISSLGRQADGTWNLIVACPKVDFHEDISFINPFTEELEEEIRWFIEDFPTNDILSRDRAQATHKSLTRATSDLVTQLKLNDILLSLTAKLETLLPVIYIDISDDLSTIDSLHDLPWEMLEHHSFWPEDTKYHTKQARQLSIQFTIRRRATASKMTPLDSHRDRDVNTKSFSFGLSVGTFKDVTPTYNVLIVTARDFLQNSDQESHTQLARSLYAAISGVEPAAHINLQVLRPGTWDALQDILCVNKRGYYNVVHLDLPAQDDYLSFNNGTGFRSDKISTSLVAQVLRRHDVSTVFLHCHEAKSKRSYKHRLPAPFVAVGIPLVASVPYNLPKIYLMLMCSGYYQSLVVLQRKGPANAAHATRRAMQYQEISRLGRYHIPTAATAEGLGLIVYDNGKLDEHDMQQYCYPPTDCTPRRFGIPYEDVWAFGRDLDVLKVEHRLLETKDSNILWLKGQKSVGTTFFLNYLMKWWGMSIFTKATLRMDLSQCLDSLAGVVQQFAEILPQLGIGSVATEKDRLELHQASNVKETKLYKALVKGLRESKIYIFFDGVDRWRPGSVERTAANEALWLRERTLFMDLMHEIRGGQSLILLVAQYNNPKMLRGMTPYVLRPLGNRYIQMSYSVEQWDQLAPGAEKYLTELTPLNNELLKQSCQNYDAILDASKGLFGARQQFVYDLPFNGEQRPRDVFCVLNTGTAGTAGPHNMDYSAAPFLIERVYDCLVDREDQEDKSPAANPNLTRLLYSLAIFSDRVPKSISTYLVLLWYYGLFTADWNLSEDKYDHSIDRYQIIEPEKQLADALTALQTSKLDAAYARMVAALYDNDYLIDDEARPDEYYRISPVLVFALRKIVYATSGPLAMPVLPLAIRLASQQYHTIRASQLDYTEKYSATSRLVLEKKTLYTQTITALNCGDNKLRQFHTLHELPWMSLFEHELNDFRSDADRRVELYIAARFSSMFPDLMTAESIDAAFAGSDLKEEEKEELLLGLWLRASMCSERIATYHSTESGLVDLFDESLTTMRKCKQFGERFSQEKRREFGMLAYDDALQDAEALRSRFVEMGLLAHEEAPPAYNA